MARNSRTYTDAEKAEAVALYQTEGPTAVQKKLGIPKNTVTTWAKALGARTVRTERTQAAVDARKADLALTRAEIVHGLYDDVKWLREQLRQPGEAVAGSGKLVQLRRVSASDARNWMTATGIALQRATDLERVDAGDAAHDARSMLSDLGEMLGIRPAS